MPEGISVIVTNYRTPYLIKEFVDSYTFQKCDVPTELIVIDVHPTEETTEEMANILKGVDSQYWPIDYNCGYSGACNFASTVAEYDTLAFFNSDTRLFDDTLTICHKYLRDNPGVGICGPLQVDSNGLVTHAGVFGTNERPQIRGWRSKSPDLFRDVRDDCVTVFGSAYFVRRECWEEMADHPKFKEMYPSCEGAMLPTRHYYEETWCSYFARHLGWKVAYVGDAIMVHEWHKSSPVGSVEGQVMRDSRDMFRETCDAFGILHD